ncbi:peroxisomal acyl-coenzyme A oxidase 1-like [Penaeus japonicus]|uniref:peroxisomal acyl-coenzyme A oxidase 1-like n=1 Tax=Penaeus japonicus TaxID=27405 RepID=UPI001C715BED|nr:peroxisomal acyl-coenzyme A oxidase 1-like [Penaeus japonicus]XP_042883921.1 peroxisomal acyl-coenzyme A oxidase 1-like [Penaeus japonicus]XP_042883922.1 peroxisomal acyl-coenzyme A oxidase 1-like [Penaeus japonicus]
MPTVDCACVPELQKERERCCFDKEELTNLIDGGKEKTADRREFEKMLLSDPEYKDEIPPSYLSHEDSYANELRKSCYTMLKVASAGKQYRELMNSGTLRGITKDGNPLALHLAMFIPAIMGQGTSEQQDYWLGRALKGEIIGTYAQTELGHGTFLRGLETRATYDPAREEFILHSPSVTAIKWWPGGLGKTSNYAVVMAQLYIDGKCLGPHPFMAQLRDESTHESLPGITLGEIGPRLGLNTNDNGFLKFEHYRIPRTNMLMKHSQVLKDGTYVKPKHDKLAYGTMVIVRVGIVRDAYKQLQRAVTIATRYSAVRRQSEIVPGEPEPQILDYQTQQYKVLPQIASVFALLFSANALASTYMGVSRDMTKGNMEQLPELHSLSSGLKALSASDATEGVEICRLSCGGHGYLKSSNLPRIYSATTCAITYEGENTVLWLQVARYLIKSYRAGRRCMALSESVAYLTSNPEMSHLHTLTNEALVEAYKMSALKLVADTESRLQKLCDMGQNSHHAWNNCSVLLVRCAQAHIRYFVCEKFLQCVTSLSISAELRAVLQQLCRLYLVYHVALNQGDFLRSGALTSAQISTLEDDLSSLLTSLRPQAVSIVDAFDIHDEILDSTLGAWDGRVYERLYEDAMKSPLNKTDVPEAYHRFLKPLMKSQL